MRQIVSEYKYQNGARATVYAIQDEPDVPDCDCLALEVQSEGSEEPTCIYFRPDEGLLLIKLIAEGMNRTISSYEVGVELDGY